MRLLAFCKFFIPFTFLSFFTKGQTNTIAILKNEITFAVDIDHKAAALLNLCRQNFSLSADSLYYYADALKKISIKEANTHYTILADYYITYSMLTKGMEDSCLKITNSYLEKLKNNKEELEAYMLFLQLKGLYNYRTNKRNETLNSFYDLLSEAQQHSDTMFMLRAIRGISLSYIVNGQDQEALKVIHNAIAFIPDQFSKKYREIYGLMLANASICFLHLHQATHSKIFADSCDYYGQAAINIGRKTENLFLLCQGLIVNGLILSYKKEFTEAEKKLQEGLEVRKIIGDTIYIISDMSVLASFYANTKQLEKGVAIVNKGIELTRGRKISPALLLLLYNALAENYRATGNYKQYADALKLQMAVKDSLNKKNSADDLNNLQLKYESQKNENIIINQKLDIVSKNYWLYGSFLLVFFGVVVTYLLLKNYRRKQKINLLSMREEEKLISYKAVLEAEENERIRIAADLHDNMGAYAAAIIANVDEMMVNNNKNDKAILTHLKSNAGEIMSNLRDTIWAANKEKILLTGISDRFKNYIQKIIPAYPNIKVEISEAIENNISFAPVYALNIFRISQEALTNSLKHSKATHIKISFISTKDFKIIISDNGKGINGFDTSRMGNGIKNMKSRALKSGYQLFINEKNTGGLEVVISD